MAEVWENCMWNHDKLGIIFKNIIILPCTFVGTMAGQTACNPEGIT